jgi:galactokinase
MTNDLYDIYGSGATEQVERYRVALAAFMGAFGPGPVSAYRAPGRVNLIGEHTDYNHGYVLPVALDRDTVLMVRPRRDPWVHVVNIETQYPPLAFVAEGSIPPGPRGDWGNYAHGAAQMLAGRMGRPLQGFDGLVTGTPQFGVPRGSGLSSSSALTVAVAVALADLNGWHLDGADGSPDRAEFAQLCAEAEWYVGTRGGTMDHSIALLAQRGHAMFMDCRPQADGSLTTEHVPLSESYRLLVVDSGVRHENTRGEFNLRVAACRAGVALLRRTFAGITHLRDVQVVPWTDLASLLPDEVIVEDLWRQGIDLGDLPGLAAGTCLQVRNRCKHVWRENERVLAAVAALRSGDTEVLGRLLNEAHASARDDYEVSCPELESLVRAAREVDGVAGARLTGAGWGGCIIALVPAHSLPAFEKHVKERYNAETGRVPPIFACRAGPGAGPVDMNRLVQG